MSAQVTDLAEQMQNDAYYCEIPNDPCAIVMFGASGDLAKRKLLPALFDLAWNACLAPRFRLLGYARTEMTDENFRQEAEEALSKGESAKHKDKQQEFLDQPALLQRPIRRGGILQAASSAA